MLVSRHVGAGTDKSLVTFLYQTQLLGIQPKLVPALIHRLHAGEKGCIESQVVLVGGEQRHHLLGNGNHLVAALALAQVEEHPAHFGEQTAAILIGQYRVLKIRLVSTRGDGLNLGLLASHAFEECRHIMVSAYAPEIRYTVWGAPITEKRIVHIFAVFAACQRKSRQHGHGCEYCFFHCLL